MFLLATTWFLPRSGLTMRLCRRITQSARDIVGTVNLKTSKKRDTQKVTSTTFLSSPMPTQHVNPMQTAAAAPMASTVEAGLDPRGHLGVTWGVYPCAGKPPLADIILSHPPDLTRCDSVIGLAIPAMSGFIQYRSDAS